MKKIIIWQMGNAVYLAIILMVQVVNKVRYPIVRLILLKIKIFVKNVMKIIIYIPITVHMHHVVL